MHVAGAKVPALATNRVLYREGIAIASLVAGEVQWLEKLAPAESRAAEAALVRRQSGQRCSRICASATRNGPRVARAVEWGWWRIRDSNPGPKDYDSSALTS